MTGGGGRSQCAQTEELPTAFPVSLFLTLGEDPETPGLSSFNLWASLSLQLSIAREVCYPRKSAETSGHWKLAVLGD